jgi:hypothetical protein
VEPDKYSSYYMKTLPNINGVKFVIGSGWFVCRKQKYMLKLMAEW